MAARRESQAGAQVSAAGAAWTAPWPRFFLLVFIFFEAARHGFVCPLVLFSHVHGMVLRDGKPVHGAELAQEVEVGRQERNTVGVHAQRCRWFPSILRRWKIAPAVPHQPVVLQKIIIRYDGRDYIAWRHTRIATSPVPSWTASR